jgi:DNA-binding CsgD family transcriptional regulator
MPTTPRRPAAQQERDRLQARRLRATELFAVGLRQAQVARQLGVSRQTSASGTPVGRLVDATPG